MKNISVKKYFLLDNRVEYNTILEHVKGKDAFHYPFALEKLTYQNVRDTERLMSMAKTIDDVKKIFTIAYQCQDIYFWELRVLNYFQTKKFLYEFFVSLKQREIDFFKSYTSDSELWNSIAGDRLKNYANDLPLEGLADKYGGYPLDYRHKPYTEITYLLGMNKVKAEVTDEFPKRHFAA